MSHDVIGAEETLPVPALGGRPYRRASSRAKTVAVRGRPTHGIRVVRAPVVVDPASFPAYAPPRVRRVPSPTIRVSAAQTGELKAVGLIMLAAVATGALAGVVAFHAFLS